MSCLLEGAEQEHQDSMVVSALPVFAVRYLRAGHWSRMLRHACWDRLAGNRVRKYSGDRCGGAKGDATCARDDVKAVYTRSLLI